MADIVFTDRDAGNALIAVVADATTHEIHRGTALATENEVEQGVAITDHVRPERDVLQLEIVVSDTPFAPNAEVEGQDASLSLDMPAVRTQGVATSEAGGTRIRVAELRDAPRSNATAVVFQPTSAPTRVRDTWEKLVDARKRALLAVVTMKLATYESMVLIEHEVTRTAKDGSAIAIALTFAEVRQVATEMLAVDPLPPRARAQVNRGSQNAAESTPRLRSAALQLTDAFGSQAATNQTLGSIFGG